MVAEPGVPRAGRLAQVAGPDFSFQASVGGVRGIIESVLPYTVFSLVYAVTKDLQTSIIGAAAPLFVLIVWRLIARETLSQALSGVLGIALGAYFAHKSGKAADFFLPNILKNAGFAALYAISILVRWPLIGVVIGPMTGEMFAWRDDPRRLSAYRWATWIWVGLFLVRLAVQIPLFLADNVTLLGTLNGLVLGIPLFVLTIWLSWLVLKSVPLAKPVTRVEVVEPAPNP
jgi:MFS family permease